MIASSIKMNIACMKLLHERKFNFDKIPQYKVVLNHCVVLGYKTAMCSKIACLILLQIIQVIHMTFWI